METKEWQEVEKAYYELCVCSCKKEIPGLNGHFCSLPGGGVFFSRYEDFIEALVKYQNSTDNSFDLTVFIGLRFHEAADIKHMRPEESEAARQAFVKRIRQELDFISNDAYTEGEKSVNVPK